jgi:hypothetical protein
MLDAEERIFARKKRRAGHPALAGVAQVCSSVGKDNIVSFTRQLNLSGL